MSWKVLAPFLNVCIHHTAESVGLSYASLAAVVTCMHSVAVLTLSKVTSIPVLTTHAGTQSCHRHPVLNGCCHAAASAHIFSAGFTHTFILVIIFILRVIAYLLECGMHTLGRSLLTQLCICTLSLALVRWTRVRVLLPNPKKGK